MARAVSAARHVVAIDPLVLAPIATKTAHHRVVKPVVAAAVDRALVATGAVVLAVRVPTSTKIRTTDEII